MSHVVGRNRRKKSIRNKVSGTQERPRLAVFRSGKHIYAQVIDDSSGVTLVSCSTVDKELKSSVPKTWNKAAAQQVGEMIAGRALAKNIKTVVFDRAGYKFHGRVKSLAEGARKGGLVF